MNFNSDNHNLFPFATTPSLAACIAAANIGLIHSNASAEFYPDQDTPWTVSVCATMSLQFDNSQTQKARFKSKSTRSVFLAGHKPHRSKPGSQGHPCTIKNGYLQLSKPRFRTSDNEGSPGLSSTVRISRRTGHIQYPSGQRQRAR